MNERGEACCGSEVGRGGRRSRLSGGGGEISFTEDEGEGRRLFLRAAEEGRTPTEDIGEVEERKSDLESAKGALELVEGESEEELFTNHQQRSKYSPRFHDASVSCSPDPSTILSIVSFSHSIAFSAHPSTGIKLSWERVVVVVVDRAGNQSFRLSPLFFDISPPFPRPFQTATRDFPSPFPLRLRSERFHYAAEALYSQQAREGGYGEVSIFLFQDLSTSSSSTEVGGGACEPKGGRAKERLTPPPFHSLLTTTRRRGRRRESQAADGIEPPSPPPPPKSALRRLFPRKKEEGEKRERERASECGKELEGRIRRGGGGGEDGYGSWGDERLRRRCHRTLPLLSSAARHSSK